MWYAKPLYGYLKESTEAIANATEMKNFLLSNNWTLNAICGMLGNVNEESSYNPWRWEYDWKYGEAAIMTKQFAYTYEGYDHGYGLFGLTPANKYCSVECEAYTGYAPNFSDEAGNPSDGQAQTYWLTQHPEQFNDPASYSPYPASQWTYNLYIRSTTDPKVLADVWMCNWEKPREDLAYSSRRDRQNTAEYWWEYFGGTPFPPVPPARSPKKFKWWMYLPR